ncbi:TPA: hypothetical protein L4810_005816 [Pseudomonas aeruginosa]|uniref:Uncharacterized protein n=1 Tax=Pseudomonas aeruginosa TaxID=287 RepID=A0A643EPA9_PSEAI|nr:hypothetical protein [Pseudomonas aeruginosa]EIU5326516.1 hypothetical protein [Pseudomonas aeruginosa]EJM8447768.1 hypothetical protein [Pseudomonas aeruginosa]EJY6040953.1 hypothetical protein [Pseudomonas aeruginosa]EJZ8923892.1 hypothetical protein [Pseudomonas aeruginosa]EKA8140294.1 hypothetical protein [Pseudomonas aeruginosa]
MSSYWIAEAEIISIDGSYPIYAVMRGAMMVSKVVYSVPDAEALLHNIRRAHKFKHRKIARSIGQNIPETPHART